MNIIKEFVMGEYTIGLNKTKIEGVERCLRCVFRDLPCDELQDSKLLDPCFKNKEYYNFLAMNSLEKEEFEYRGRKMKTIKCSKSFRCEDCFFFKEDLDCSLLRLKGEIPNCYEDYRDDEENVYFVEK